MKNIIGYFAGAALSAALLAGCNASEDYDGRTPSPAQNPDCIQVYFPEPSSASLEYEVADPTQFTVTVARVKADKAATVPITVQMNTDNVFKVPAAVEFSPSQTTADIVVNFPDAVPGVEYTLTLAVEGDDFMDPYYTGNPDVTFTVSRLSWKLFATGDYYAAPFDKTTSGVELYHAEGTDKYRFFDLYAEGYNFNFRWDGQSAELLPGGVPKVYTDLVEYELYVQASGFVNGADGMAFWTVDATPDYTFYDADADMFQFEFVLTYFEGDVISDTPSNAAGWYDDTFTITSRAETGGE